MLQHIIAHSTSSLYLFLGTFGADGGYRYYASPAPPYFVGCFKGIKGSFEIVSSSDTACPYNGVLYDTYTNCFKSKGPFFLFRTDTEGENWEVFFIIAAIGNGLLFLLCLWRTLELLFETLDQRIIHIALLDFVLLTQVLFYAVDPNHTRGIFPDLVSSLLYGAQFWATDGLIALAIIKHVNALLPLRKANERLKNIKNDQEKRTILKRMIKKDKRLRKSLTAVLDFQQHLRMSRGSVVAMTRGSSIQTNIPGNPRIKQKVWFDFKFARSYFAFLIFCIVFQTWSDIMRVSVQENHWWISIWRFLYLGSGYLLAILFVISLFSIYNIAKFLATRSLQKMAAYIFDTVLIVCTCLCMSTIELYLFLNKDIPTSSSVYFGLTAANIGVRLLLYFLTWYRTRIQFARYQNPFASFADSVFSRRSSKVDSGLPNPGRKSSRLSMHEVKRAVLMARHISEDSERSGPEVRLSNLHRSGGKVELREGLFPHEGKRPLAHQIHRRTGGSLMSESGTVQYPAGALQKMETKQDLEKAQLDNDIEMLCMHLRSCTPSQSKSQLFNPLDQTNCMRTGLDMGGSLPTLPHLDDEEKAKQRLRPRKRQASESRLRKANRFGSPSEFLRSNSYQRASSLGYSGVELISRRGTSVGVLSPTRQVRHSKSDVEREVPRYYSPGNSKSDVERETTPERVISSPMRPSVQREPREHRSVRACGIRADSYDFRDDRSEKSFRQSPRDVDSSAKCFTQSPRAVDNPKSLGQSPRGVDSSLQNYQCAQLSMASNQSHVETSCSPQRKAGMSGTSCSETIPSPGGKPGVHAMETVEEKGPGCLAGQVRQTVDNKGTV